MCARHGREAIEICLSEKEALAKKRLGNTGLQALHTLINIDIGTPDLIPIKNNLNYIQHNTGSVFCHVHIFSAVR